MNKWFALLLCINLCCCKQNNTNTSKISTDTISNPIVVEKKPELNVPPTPEDLYSEDGKFDPVDSANEKASMKKNGFYRKTMDMVYMSYSEGDYPHLIFKDMKTGKNYDFQYLDKNNLSGLAILLADDRSGFGYKMNDKLGGTAFTVQAKKMKLNAYDLQGDPVKVEGWIIEKIRERK